MRAIFTRFLIRPMSTVYSVGGLPKSADELIVSNYELPTLASNN